MFVVCSLVKHPASDDGILTFLLTRTPLPLNKYIYPLLDEAIHAADKAPFSWSRCDGTSGQYQNCVCEQSRMFSFLI